MKIFAISDLHLSSSGEKPMDIFGEHWKNHDQQMADNWDSVVKPEDLVLIAGDICWANKFYQAKEDIEWISKRPGKKVLIRGNHDYWWRRESTHKMQQEMPQDIVLLQGTAIIENGIAITGTRGWRIEEQTKGKGSERVMKRELTYLENGLAAIPQDAVCKIAMLHYPPFEENLQHNEFSKILRKYNTDILVYGHIHGGDYLEGNINGVKYYLTSADHLNFQPLAII